MNYSFFYVTKHHLQHNWHKRCFRSRKSIFCPSHSFVSQLVNIKLNLKMYNGLLVQLDLTILKKSSNTHHAVKVF